MGCWIAKGLIAACVGYMPASGASVAVKRGCVSGYSKIVKAAAKRCARDHGITYRIED